MGNCLYGGTVESGGGSIRVITSTGGVMELHAPVTVESITEGFPNHGIFRSRGIFWKPLPLHEELLAGESYYLLPIDGGGKTARKGHVRSCSFPAAAPYRMSFESQAALQSTETVPSCGKASSNGAFWKVKLVIRAELLAEIMSQEKRTEELIENVRTVAKCGNLNGGILSSGVSDHWSRSSSKKD